MSAITSQLGVRQAELLKKFQLCRSLTEKLCEPLQPEDFVVQPVADVSPPKWHLAHTTWFFENFVLKHTPDYQVFDKDYHFLFNSYYETEGERWIRSERGSLSRPWVNEIMAYRNYIDEHIKSQFNDRRLNQEQLDIFEIGIHHEQQHQELLLYDIKHILGVNPLFPTYRSDHTEELDANVDVKMLPVESGIYSIGHQAEGFHFDNEKGVHQVYLHAYEIMDRLVTNGEFLDFVESGAYADFRFWLMEGFEWVKANQVKAPFYWIKEGEEWFHFTLAGKKPINLNEPVAHISFYEADAYARWKGMRLPTEFEWEVACRKYEPYVPDQANFLDDTPLRPKARRGDHKQFFGDLWEWTASPYTAYPFYKAPDGALGEYNGKFMVNQMVLRGGSYATMRSHIRPTYRNFFHPHLRWQLTGLRLARHKSYE